MNIVLYGRPQASFVEEDLNALFEALESNGLSCRINRDFARLITEKTGRAFDENQLYDDSVRVDPRQDIMVSYGGDGTFLDCVRLLDHQPVPVVGINSGRLGFLANVTKQGMARAFADLKSGNYETTARTMIRIEGEFLQNPRFPYAFNEVSVQRNGPNMISTEVYVNDEMIATYWGDGILVSTPSGSTAYSLSVGGPVVSPDCRCILISPIASHNLTMRPVVIPDSCEILLRAHARQAEMVISADNAISHIGEGATFTVKRARRRFFLAVSHNISFYDTLRNKMMWGVDIRS